jgi:ribulose-5-phosphate 4-epimerase/fuculose-1-phosphate aldolase
MHTHTTTGCAVAGAQAGLSMDNFYSAQLHGRIAYHDFEGITVHAEEGARILESAAGRPVLMLRNHGPVTIGASLPQALSLMWLVNRACDIQLASSAMGALRPIATPVLEKCVADSLNFNPAYGAGRDAFDALQRLVDRIDPSYRG